LPNEEKAVIWYQKAAAQGNALAQIDLGHCYEKRFSRENAEKAFQCYYLAAKQNNAEGQRLVGNCYLLGFGVLNQDEQEAIKWYGMSAAQGNEQAKQALKKLTGKDN
jgi:TPR repeat protein